MGINLASRETLKWKLYSREFDERSEEKETGIIERALVAPAGGKRETQ